MKTLKQQTVNVITLFRMPLDMIHVGQICVTIYHGDKNWNRAIVTQEPKVSDVPSMGYITTCIV